MNLLNSHSFRQSIPSVFISTKPTWPDSERSIGRECSKISGQRCWEVTGPALDIMNKLSVPIMEMLDKNQEILEQGELKPRAVSFHMWMIGCAASAANPTIVFSSKSRHQRTFAKILLKESKLLDGYSGIKIKTLDKAPAIYQAADFNLDLDNEGVSNDGIYMVDDSRGVCGSLVAFGNSRLATMGGVILIGNVHYGISAQHARFNHIRERQALTSEPADVPCFDDDSDSEYCDLIEITSRGSISPDSDYGPDTESLTSSGMLADSIFEPPYAPSSVDKRSQEVEERVNTPQDGRFCGQRIADISANYIQTDLDYEIFPLDDPRFHTVNNISLPTTQESAQILRPGKPARLPVDADVWVVTGTTGAVRGSMTSIAYFIKMEGSRTFQEMWAVRLDRETRPGDCGAWVIDALTGSIYGHVIAGDPSSSMAYIIPAYKIFDDIENRFGVPARLPSEPPPNPIERCIIGSSEPVRSCTTVTLSSAAALNSALTFSGWPAISLTNEPSAVAYASQDDKEDSEFQLLWRRVMDEGQDDTSPAYYLKRQFLLLSWALSCPHKITKDESGEDIRRFIFRPEVSDVENIASACLTYLALPNILGDPPEHCDESSDVLVGRCFESRSARQWRKRRAACRDSLEDIQDHEAPFGINFSFNDSSCRKSNLHAPLDLPSATFSRDEVFLLESHYGMDSFGYGFPWNSLTFLLKLVLNLLAYSEANGQIIVHDKTPVESIIHSLMRALYVLIDGLDEKNNISLLTASRYAIRYHRMIDSMCARFNNLIPRRRRTINHLVSPGSLLNSSCPTNPQCQYCTSGRRIDKALGRSIRDPRYPMFWLIGVLDPDRQRELQERLAAQSLRYHLKHEETYWLVSHVRSYFSRANTSLYYITSASTGGHQLPQHPSFYHGVEIPDLHCIHCQIVWPSSEPPQSVRWWYNMVPVRAIDFVSHSPHYIHSVAAVFTPNPDPHLLLANSSNVQATRCKNAESRSHNTHQFSAGALTRSQHNPGCVPLTASLPGLTRNFFPLYEWQSNSGDHSIDARMMALYEWHKNSSGDHRIDAQMMESLRLLLALASRSAPASCKDDDDVDQGLIVVMRYPPTTGIVSLISISQYRSLVASGAFEGSIFYGTRWEKVVPGRLDPHERGRTNRHEQARRRF